MFNVLKLLKLSSTEVQMSLLLSMSDQQVLIAFLQFNQSILVKVKKFFFKVMPRKRLVKIG